MARSSPRCYLLACLLALFLALVPTGCGGHGGAPITTTFSRLTAETENRHAGPLQLREIVSVSGQLMIPDVGTVYHYPQVLGFGNEFAPNHVVGVSTARDETSFGLTLSLPTPPDAAMNEVVGALTSVQARIRSAILLTVQLRRLEVELQEARRYASNDQIQSIQENMRKLAEQIASNDTSLINDQKAFTTAVMATPGIMVVRWTRRVDNGINAEVGKILSGIFESSSTVSGYAIIGGPKITQMYFGNDFRRFIVAMRTLDYMGFRDFSRIPMYLLRANSVKYLSGVDISTLASFVADIDVKNLKGNLTDLDRVKIRGYLAMAESLSNTGNLTGATWHKREIHFAHQDNKRITNGVLDDSNIQLRPHDLFADAIESTNGDGASVDAARNNFNGKGLLTLHAVMVSAPGLYDLWRWEDWWGRTFEGMVEYKLGECKQ